jgi:transglutaminase-like putative cysteine protease
MHADRPAPGDVLDRSILDPQSGRDHPARITVSPETTMVVVDSAAFDAAAGRWVPARLDTLQAWRLDERGRDGVVRTWVDRQGFVVRAETAEGLVLERTAFEIASNNFQAGKAAPFAGAPVATLPARIATDAPSPRDTMAELLIPSEAPAVLAMARRLRGPDDDPAGTARTILRWVVREIAPAPARRGRPRPVAAIAARRGDDISRALLFVALLRASGIPARTVTGVAPGPDGWRPRVWAEVGLDGWTPVDPITGEWPADTSLVRLRTGGAGRPLEVLPLAARLGAPPSSPSGRQ